VTDAIRECVEKAGITGTNTVISVSGREAIVKRVPLPKVTAKELGDAIQLEAEHHIPFAIDDVFLDYQVVSQSANAMSVVLVATKKVKVLEYVAAVEAAGLDAVGVDLDAFAMQNQFELSSGGDGADAVALIDIGASVMKTNVIQGGACIFARDVPFGGNNYTDAIAQRLSISVEMAEAAKQGREVGVNWDDLVPALEAVSRELSLEVQRTFDYFASTAESERIGKIVLSGGCAKLTGLDDFLGSSWGVPVELARPFQGIEHDAAQFAEEDPEQIGPVLAVAVGLALRRRETSQHDQVNLALHDQAAAPTQQWWRELNLGVLLVDPGRSRADHRWLVAQHVAESRRLTAGSRTTDASSSGSAIIAAGQRYRRSGRARAALNAIETVAEPGPAGSPLDAMADTLPRLWLTVGRAGPSLRIAGTTYSSVALSDFMANLKASVRFKDVDLLDAKQDLTKSPRTITFEVSCRFEI
jgi:type IV pilus assembly protein PilM